MHHATLVSDKLSKLKSRMGEYAASNSIGGRRSPRIFVQNDFEDRDIGEITSTEVFAFLAPRTEGLKQSTKHQKYACLMSFFDSCSNALEATISNSCDTIPIRKHSAD